MRYVKDFFFRYDGGASKTTRIDEINKMVAWRDIQYQLEKILARSGFGPSRYDSLQLLKVLLWQNLYGLSDPAME